MTEAIKTQVCRSCGRELPIESFMRTHMGIHKTCRECLRKKQLEGKEAKRKGENIEKELAKAKHLRISEFTPRELMGELKRRGYEFTMKYTEVHVIDSKDIKA